ncbi:MULTISPECIES: hypothetical protein [unclassified Ekhidna]|jgi:hypothetical protein|uniref:hypothetical protein n=1 Tax=unclassified Ekhidna TaxID=2632188 RepID=UPI0032DF6BF3
MRHSIKNVGVLLVAACVLLIPISCSNDDSSSSIGLVRLSFDDRTDSSGRVMSNEISAALISLEEEDGTPVFISEEVTLYDFNGKKISEAIGLPVGTYVLTEFHLIDDVAAILYSSPLIGSELAHLVENPLPLTITVSANDIETVSPEVLSILEFEPEDFGYSAFSFSIVETVDFLLSVLAFNLDPLVLDWELTSANVDISNGGNSIYEGELEALSNEIIIPQGEEDLYVITISKDGFGSITEEYTEEQLSAYSDSPLLMYLGL